MGTLFYRCLGCGKAVTPWDVEKGGCQNCGGGKVKPTNLSLWEKIVMLCKHPELLWGGK